MNVVVAFVAEVKLSNILRALLDLIEYSRSP